MGFPALNDEEFDFEMEIEMSGVKCEDVLPEDKCTALREAAQKLKEKMQVVDAAVREAVAKGIVKAKEISEHVQKKILELAEKAKSVKCADILGEEKCKALREAAGKLKEQAKVVDAAVREAVAKGVTKAKEIVKTVQEKIAALSTSKCEDILDETICSTLKTLAEKIKIKAAEVDKTVKEIVAKGVSKIKEIVHMIKEKLFPALNTEEFLDMDAINCEDILPEEKCAVLREAAQKLKEEMQVVDAAVREAVAKGIVKIKEVSEHVQKKILELAEKAKSVKCADILGEEKCQALREAAAKLKEKAEKVDAAVREAVAKGVTKAKEIVKTVQEKIAELSKAKC